MHSECVSLCSGSPLWCLKRPCVWSEWFLSSRSEPVSDTSDCSLTHTHAHTHHTHTQWWVQRGPINKAFLIQPQPNSLPSCLCLREDTTAVTQTAVYPLLLAVVRGIIHMLLCQNQEWRERERHTQRAEERQSPKTNREIKYGKQCLCLLIYCTTRCKCLHFSCFHHPVFSNSCRLLCNIKVIRWQWFFRAVAHGLHHSYANTVHWCGGAIGGFRLQALAKYKNGAKSK